MEAERETYRNSRLGFDTMYNDLQKKYDEERASKQVILLNRQSNLYSLLESRKSKMFIKVNCRRIINIFSQ